MKKLVLWILVAIGFAAAVYAITFRSIEVEHRRVTAGIVRVEALGTGSIESRRTVEVGFEVTGRVSEVRVDQGDKVENNQELARLDDRTFKAEVALATQEVALAKSTLARLKTDIERAEAVWKGADEAFRRMTALVKAGTASIQSLDDSRERHEVATAGLARSEAAQVEGQAAIDLARHKLERAEIELARTVVTSPFAGVVLRRVREVGDVVSPGTSVLVIAASDTIWASVWVDETYLSDLRVGLPAKIVLRSEPGQAHDGRVARIGREVDRETRELLVDVTFEHPPEKLAFGQRVDLWIELGKKEGVLRLPAQLLIQVDGKDGVRVDTEGRAHFQPVEVGARGRGYLEIVSGLSEGELVLQPHDSNQKLLNEGTRVRAIGREVSPEKPIGPLR